MTRIVIYTPATLPSVLRRTLDGLNFRSEGNMRGIFRRKYWDDCYYVAKNGPVVIGWAMTFDWAWQANDTRSVYYYVRKSHRGRGFGLRIAQKVYENEGKLVAYTDKFPKFCLIS